MTDSSKAPRASKEKRPVQKSSSPSKPSAAKAPSTAKAVETAGRSAPAAFPEVPSALTDGVSDEVEETAPDNRSWYVVHSYSGMENKVKKNLEHRIESMHVGHKIFQVIVPTEEQIELKEGQRRVVERRVFPGYILVQMVLDDESWYVVRNTPGVTGFVGIGNQPTPLSTDEVDRIMRRIESAEPRVQVDFKVGERVRVTEGAFAEFQGVVDAIDLDRGKARIMISIFGRETPVEVDFLQLQKV